MLGGESAPEPPTGYCFSTLAHTPQYFLSYMFQTRNHTCRVRSFLFRQLDQNNSSGFWLRVHIWCFCFFLFFYLLKFPSDLVNRLSKTYSSRKCSCTEMSQVVFWKMVLDESFPGEFWKRVYEETSAVESLQRVFKEKNPKQFFKTVVEEGSGREFLKSVLEESFQR